MDLDLKAHPFFLNNRREFTIRYRPSANSHEVLNQSRLPYLPIHGIPVPHQAMAEEALRLESVAIPHRAAYESHRGWKSLVVHGISALHTQGAERYGMVPEDQSIYHWTDIARLCPVTTRFFKEELGYKCYQRVRFMYLEPGGYIMPHTDADHFYLGPVNIALNNPPGCRFLMEGVGEVPFSPGQINKLALVNTHAVFNDSPTTRVHMIVHGSPDESKWSPIYMSSYRALIHQSSRFVADLGADLAATL